MSTTRRSTVAAGRRQQPEGRRPAAGLSRFREALVRHPADDDPVLSAGRDRGEPETFGFRCDHLHAYVLPAARALDDRRRRGECHGGLRLVAAAQFAHPDVLDRLQQFERLRPRLQPSLRISQLEGQDARAGALQRPHHVRRRQALGGDFAPGREMALGRGIHRSRRQVHVGRHVGHKAYGSQLQAVCARVFGDTGAYKVTGKYEITVDLPAYSIDFVDSILGAIAIMPEHAYKDIKPEALRSHTASTWLGTYTVKTSDGKSFTARGAVGTGPSIPWASTRHARPTATSATRPTGSRTPATTEDVLPRQHQRHGRGAERAEGRRDRRARPDVQHPGPVVSTIDPKWGKVLTFDSYKWQHICYNLKHPVFGVGTDSRSARAIRRGRRKLPPTFARL